ncbi:MAG: hypothetical protein IMY71_04075 [Bacteroidetes bacterium]|nr:hypothetical protein [Bacteroidota bacterium]
MINIRIVVCKTFIFLGIYFSFALIAYSQEENPDYDLFKSQQILKIHLTFHIDSLLNNRNVDTKDHLGILTYFETDGRPTDIRVIVRIRGNFRKNPDNCSFPPLRLDFLTDNSEDRLFRGLEWLKLVTHCQTDSSKFEQFVLQEYLLYKTYNIISPFSFNVRLLDIKYIDSSGSVPTIQSYGFFIERPKQMAQRNNGELVKTTDVIFYKDLDKNSLVKLSLFQYMIWNNDWSVALLHNVKFVKTTIISSPIPVPYDFDWAGIVSAPYRVRYITDNEENVADVSYMGICLKKKELIPFFDFYFGVKNKIYSLYRDFPYLDDVQKERTLHMYDDFYSLIKKPAKANSKFKETCFSKKSVQENK